MEIRFAREEELGQVNELREQVNELHVKGKPEIFKPGFSEELQNYIFEIFRDPLKRIVICRKDDKICGFAVLNHVTRPETPYMYERDFLDIDEFCVDSACRRQGIAAKLVSFIRDYAQSRGFDRIELNMWEFNREALAFYSAAGFSTYRRYMEMKIE